MRCDFLPCLYDKTTALCLKNNTVVKPRLIQVQTVWFYSHGLSCFTDVQKNCALILKVGADIEVEQIF